MTSLAYDVGRLEARLLHAGGAVAVFACTLDNTVQLAEHRGRLPEYIDVHRCRFLGSSFWLLIEDLRAIGMTTLRKAAFRHHGAHEFFIARLPNGPGPDRVALAGLIADDITMRRI